LRLLFPNSWLLLIPRSLKQFSEPLNAAGLLERRVRQIGWKRSCVVSPEDPSQLKLNRALLLGVFDNQWGIDGYNGVFWAIQSSEFGNLAIRSKAA